MNRIAAAGAALALIGIFVAITVSVVDARRPLDGRVSRSFDTVLSRSPAASVAVSPVGCVKTAVDLYRCSAEVRGAGGTSRSVHWKLLLAEDGCWRTYYRWPPAPAGSVDARLGYPRGCAG